MIYLGDSLEVLRTLEDNSVDSLITDPPAGISFMNKKWDDDKGGRDQWIEWLSTIMKECLRVMKPGAHGLLWALPKTSHWTATALENAGFEIRDIVNHLFGSGFPKSLNIGKKLDDWKGWGTGLKPACEHWILIRKPLSEKNVAENVLKWGCGGINIDECRVGTLFYSQEEWNNKQKNRKTVYIYGKHKGSESQVPSGRFPSNLILSHNEDCEYKGEKKIECKGGAQRGSRIKTDCGEAFYKVNVDQKLTLYNEDGTETVSNYDCTEGCAVKELDEQSGVLKSGGKKNASYSNDNEGIFTPGGNQKSSFYGSLGGASRFFYCSKASTSDRNEGCEGLEEKEIIGDVSFRSEGLHGQTGKSNKPILSKNHHPTVKSTKLMSYLIKLITPHHGVILDPFMGSGSTGKAAYLNNFEFIGIEKEPEYFEIAKARIDYELKNRCNQISIGEFIGGKNGGVNQYSST